MKQENILDRGVSFTDKAAGGKICGTVSLRELADDIRNGTHQRAVDAIRNEPKEERQKKLKETEIGAWMLAGVFDGRGNDNLKIPAGFVGLDADVNPEPEVVRQDLEKSEFTVLVAKSVRGKDHFAVVHLDPIPESADQHAEAAKQVVEHFNRKKKIVATGQSGAEKLRYYTYDPDVYLNEKAKPFRWNPSKKTRAKREKLVNGAKIGEGDREPFLCHKVGGLIYQNLYRQIIHNTAQDINKLYFAKPHSEDYVAEKVDEWIARFEPGPEESLTRFLNRIAGTYTNGKQKAGEAPGADHVFSTHKNGVDAAKPKVISYGGLLTPPSPQLFVVGQHIPENHLSVLAAPGGSGKSYLATHLALCVGLGRSFLGLTTRKCNVLYVDFEQKQVDFDRRLVKVSNGMGLECQIPETIKYWKPDDVLTPDTSSKIYRDLIETINEQEIGLVIVDSLSIGSAGQDVKNEQPVIPIFKKLADIGTTVFGLDHVTHNHKGQKNPKAYGTVFKENTARSMMGLSKDDQEIFCITKGKSNFAGNTPDILYKMHFEADDKLPGDGGNVTRFELLNPEEVNPHHRLLVIVDELIQRSKDNTWPEFKDIWEAGSDRGEYWAARSKRQVERFIEEASKDLEHIEQYLDHEGLFRARKPTDKRYWVYTTYTRARESRGRLSLDN